MIHPDYKIEYNGFWGMWQVYLDGSLYAEFKTEEEAKEYAEKGTLQEKKPVITGISITGKNINFDSAFEVIKNQIGGMK